MSWKNPVTQFRIVALAEGLSYLLLLGWAMPMKYLYHQPEAVRILGSIHGGLFVLYLVTIFRVASEVEWSFKRIVEAFVASLLPFGPLFIEYKYRHEFATQTKNPPDGNVDQQRPV